MEARISEPRVALDGGTDGLDVHRRVAAEAPNWLAPGGHLLIEMSGCRASLAVEVFAGHKLVPQVVVSNELDVTIIMDTWL